SLEAESAGARRPVDPHLLDPCQVARAEQAARDRIEAPNELVPEPQHGVVSVLAFFEHLGLAQVGEDKAQVEGGISQERRDGLLRPIEAVLSVEAHRQMLSRSGVPSRLRERAQGRVAGPGGRGQRPCPLRARDRDRQGRGARSARILDHAVEQRLSGPHSSRLPSPAMRGARAQSQLWAFAYLSVRRVLEFVVLLARSDDAKEIELLALRHEVVMLRRQVKRQSFEPADRALLAAYSRLLPRSRWVAFGVTPATLLG